MNKKLLSILILCLAALKLSAQELTVKSFALSSTDIISSKDQKKDYNGRVCALIKVQVIDQITRVEGNVIGEVQNHGNEKWIYVTEGTKTIRIHTKSHLPLSIDCRQYDIEQLDGKCVYILTLTSPYMRATDGSALHMNISPTAAKVTIDGSSYVLDENGKLSITLPYGRYNYQVTAPNYRPKQGSIFIGENDETITVALVLLTGALTILNATDDADIYMDGKAVGKGTRWHDDLLIVGRHVIEIRKEGYISQSRTINLEADKEETVSFDALLPVPPPEPEPVPEPVVEPKQAPVVEPKQEPVVEPKQEPVVEPEPVPTPAAATPTTTAPTRATDATPKAFSFGLRAGLNLATTQFDSSVDGSTGMQTGFHLGVTADVRLSGDLYFAPALLYSAKGYKYTQDNIEENGKAQYLTIPLQLAYHLGSIQLSAGPYVALGMGGTVDANNRTPQQVNFFDYYDGFDYGVTLGVGTVVAGHFYVGASYELGLGSYRNRNIGLSVGYNF